MSIAANQSKTKQALTEDAHHLTAADYLPVSVRTVWSAASSGPDRSDIGRMGRATGARTLILACADGQRRVAFSVDCWIATIEPEQDGSYDATDIADSIALTEAVAARLRQNPRYGNRWLIRVDIDDRRSAGGWVVCKTEVVLPPSAASVDQQQGKRHGALSSWVPTVEAKVIAAVRAVCFLDQCE